MLVPRHLIFLQAGCSSWHPTNSANLPKHRRQFCSRKIAKHFRTQWKFSVDIHPTERETENRHGDLVLYFTYVPCNGRHQLLPADSHRLQKMYTHDSICKKHTAIRSQQGRLEFNIPFQHKYGYIRDDCQQGTTGNYNRHTVHVCYSHSSMIHSSTSVSVQCHHQLSAFSWLVLLGPCV